ncbi:MAG: DUF3726 domain-containing protein [Minwuia sp.]|nr:DUF3726 domain-containing protein [Minwuia sp.]
MSDLPLSFGELHFYCCRAAFGAGLPWGLAEDAAATAVWLARQGRDPSPDLAAALDSLSDGAAVTAVKHERSATECVLFAGGGNASSALVTGPSAADWWQVMKQDPAARLVVRNVDVPGWVFACIAARTGGAMAADHAADVTGDVVVTANDMIAKASGGKDQLGFATVDQDAWAIVQHHFRRSLVPSSDASRASGAGAGLVDTD